MPGSGDNNQESCQNKANIDRKCRPVEFLNLSVCPKGKGVWEARDLDIRLDVAGRPWPICEDRVSSHDRQEREASNPPF